MTQQELKQQIKDIQAILEFDDLENLYSFTEIQGLHNDLDWLQSELNALQKAEQNEKI